MIIGISIIVDAEFRTNAICALCEQPIGGADFLISITPKEKRARGDSVVLENDLSIAHLIDVEQKHTHCAKLMAEATDATFPRRSKP